MLLCARLACQSRCSETFLGARWRFLLQSPAATPISGNLTSALPISCKPFATRVAAARPAKPTLSNSSSAKPPAPKPFVTPIPKALAQLARSLPPPEPFTGTKGKAPQTPQPGQAYPSQLLIYHAGSALNAFVASAKLGAIFVFLFCALFLAPAYYYSPYESSWIAPLIVMGGTIPLGIMVLTTYPFVSYVHIALPQFARLSRDRLDRYLANLPSTAVMDITSLRWIWPRVTRLQVSELWVLSSRASGAMTLRRNVPETVQASRRWYDYRPEKGFMVGGRSGKVKETDVWPKIMAVVKEGTFQTPRKATSASQTAVRDTVKPAQNPTSK